MCGCGPFGYAAQLQTQAEDSASQPGKHIFLQVQPTQHNLRHNLASIEMCNSPRHDSLKMLVLNIFQLFEMIKRDKFSATLLRLQNGIFLIFCPLLEKLY